MKRAVCYIRVSTDEQHLGADAQLLKIREWCARESVELVDVFEDHGVSGGAPLDKRPGLMMALDALRVSKCSILLVAKRDRLARDVVVAAMVERLAERDGARVMAADGTGNIEGPEGMLMRGIVDLFAQYERALIRARTKAALRVKRSRGEYTGGHVPYGFALSSDGNQLVAQNDEQRMLEVARDLRGKGLSLRKIGERLETRGFLSRTGRRLDPRQVSRLLVTE